MSFFWDVLIFLLNLLHIKLLYSQIDKKNMTFHNETKK